MEVAHFHDAGFREVDVQKKVVVVGDPFVGKTSFLLRKTSGEAPSRHRDQNREHSIVSTIDLVDATSGTAVELSCWDTFGQDDYDHIHPLLYVAVDVVLILYSIVCDDTIENVAEKVCCKPHTNHPYQYQYQYQCG